jgi:hypothetical protein
MTVISQEFGYLESDYLEDPYLTGLVHGNVAFQATFVIEDDKPLGFQAEAQITDFPDSKGFQAEAQIIDFPKPVGVQAEGTIADFLDENGVQATAQIIDFPKNAGFQAELTIADYNNPSGFQVESTPATDQDLGFQVEAQTSAFEDPEAFQVESELGDENAQGFEMRSDKALVHLQHPAYLTQPYLTEAYLSSITCVIMGFQVEAVIDEEDAQGFQVESNPDIEDGNGFQAELNILDFLNNSGFQVEGTINVIGDGIIPPHGFQAQGVIEEEVNLGFQAQLVIEDDVPLGFQFESLTFEGIGFQFRSAIYNSNQLRIMCEFPSRGEVVSNWVANTTATGDFDVNNVNTDIEEQIWRAGSGVKTGIQLDCDTGLPQGVGVDTVAILGTNLTTSATVTLIGSDSPVYSTIDRSIPLQVLNSGRIYHVSADLPLTAQRYWRLEIDDPTNSEDPEVGIIIFGTGDIFNGECIVDEITFQQKDFTKTVRTEGQTNVMNSRAQKRVLGLEFRQLDVNGPNYEILRDMFETYRTTHKCLWIPTPDPVDPRNIDRYSVFAKLSEVPSERHNNKGPNNTHADFGVNLDESL